MTQPLSKIIKPRCPYCNKLVDVVSELKLPGQTLCKLTCGHTTVKENLVLEPEPAAGESDFFSTYKSYSGKTLYPYQVDGVKFVIGANGRALIADDTGLGKTLQALALIKKMGWRRGIYVCKAGLRDQVEHEYYEWVGEQNGLARVIREPRIDKIWIKQFPFTIVSYESLHRCSWLDDDELLSKLEFVIIDEVQKIKSLKAKATQAVRKLCHNGNRHVPYVIGLSGTPIKNNAAEYFPILNILRPDIFNNFEQFTYKYVDTWYKGQYKKYGGLDRRMIEEFQSTTSKFIIRRLRDDVLPDLPKIQRNYLYNDLGEAVQEQFDALVDKFMQEYMSGNRSFAPGSNLVAIMSMMRYVVGIAKVGATMDFVEEFLQNTTRKLVIFVRHHDVDKLLKIKLGKLLDADEEPIEPPLSLVGVPPDKREDIINEFKNNPLKRIMIGSTQASGEGLNLQFCSDAMILEFEWNYANEYQAETRFTRPGFEVTEENQNKVTITRPVAIGTIDEFMTELKERKKVYSDQTLDGKVGATMDESSVMKELADKIVASGMKRWSVKDAGKKTFDIVAEEKD